MFSPSARNPRHGAPKRQVARREERVSVTKSAGIYPDGGETVIACTVRDIHSQGARLSVINMAGVTDEFMLMSRTENLVARCKVAWRRESEIGVRFLRTGDLLQEDQFRREQLYHSQKAQEQAQKQQQQMQAEAEAQARAQAQFQAQQLAVQRAQQLVILGMDPQLPYSMEDLKQAYRQQAMQKHPDQGGDPQEFQLLNDVYAALVAGFAPASMPAPQNFSV